MTRILVNCTVLPAASLLWLLQSPCLSASNDAPTTGTLRLSDLFDTRPGPAGFVTAPGSFDPSGPVLVIPDISAWRLPPPTPEPTPAPFVPLPEGMNLPRFQPLILQSRKDDRLLDQPAFQSRGIANRISTPRNAAIAIGTEFAQLRTEYRLYRFSEGSESGENLLTVLHGPATSEVFEVPEGTYRLLRRVWLPGNPSASREEIFAEQTIAGGNAYSFVAPADSEMALIELLGK